MKGFLATIALLIASTSQALELPISYPDSSCPGYSTINDAAKAALLKAAQQSTQVEYGGVIYRQGDLFCFTVPVTNNEKFSVAFKASLLAGTKKVALYHTHPKGKHSERFSSDDVETARGFNLPSFIGVIQTGEVRLYKPVRKRPTELRSQSELADTDAGVIVASMDR
jgi:hypothetical protein